ncbi:hypothetical protein HMPREF1613_01729 [Escherichia coli 908616]|nr:hypothetical protein HMPREF1588_04960 [Escherichia coli 110957]ESD19301.1 hypothetical protein HMPREF1600_04830 [Escherichia coli 907715]ESD58608.1 hypothetical protein HMPREF1605_00679 [Escherichia coli 908521]ESD91973.1 hypothetical protein HMPREF1613_01729 [Escherichia coli 908616]ESD92052.1 hypothetical protein HMPREF1612_01591 [Escherichia coli 908585]ESE21344.1 hypothetical protein HMPREF1617_00748 [Escherichia coli 908675]
MNSSVRLAECRCRHQMHTVPVINIVRNAATATAISNPGKKRYQV